MLSFVLMLLFATNSPETLVQYRPGDTAAGKVWDKFYAGDHEPELPLPLIRAGKRMTPFVCQAVRHPDMKFRRYALAALGHLHDRSALPTLRAILASKSEIDYFRGDALQAIFVIDRDLGTSLSAEYRNENAYLARIAKAIDEGAAWLTEPPGEGDPR